MNEYYAQLEAAAAVVADPNTPVAKTGDRVGLRSGIAGR